jgi:hypothetical protein
MPVLRVLNMTGCCQRTISDTGIAGLAQSRTLEKLEMLGCAQDTITDTALTHLSRCGTLTYLDLSSCTQRTLTAAGARALASSRSLRFLRILATVLDEHAALLGESASLQSVVLEVCRPQSFTQWSRAHSALLHAPRLALCAMGAREEDMPSAMAVLQAAWEARPAAVRELRIAASAASVASAADVSARVGALTIKFYCAKRAGQLSLV